MSIVIDQYIPMKLASLTNLREHWAARDRRAKKQRGTTMLVMQSRLIGVRLPAVVTITRIAPRALDQDNLVSSCKHVIDGLADALGIDDRDPRVTWHYAQRKGKPREYGVELRIVGDDR